MKKCLFYSTFGLILTFFCQSSLAQSGNVGIGTANPQAKLHVAGDTRIDSTLEIKNSAGATIFKLDPENKSFEFLDTDGSIFYRLAIQEEETANVTDKGQISETRNTPGDPKINTFIDSETGNIISKSLTIDNEGIITLTNTVLEPNGISTTTITQGAGGVGIQIITVEDPNTGSTIVTHIDINGNSTETFTDAAGKTISVFESGVLVSRKVFDKDGNKIVDFDGNTATITPIGLETSSPDGIDFFVDCFGISKLDADFNFTGLSMDPTDGITADGDTDIIGFLSKLGGSFKIDHPLDPTNKWLYHSFVESPDMMNIYNGNVTTDANGVATVELPEYFGVLNNDFRYQLTPIGVFAQAIISEEVHNNKFKIKTSMPDVKVSWQVTGIRQDNYAKDNRIEVEVEKTGWDKGKLRYNPNRSKPYTEGLQNHWERHEEKRNRSDNPKKPVSNF